MRVQTVIGDRWSATYHQHTLLMNKEFQEAVTG